MCVSLLKGKKNKEERGKRKKNLEFLSSSLLLLYTLSLLMASFLHLVPSVLFSLLLSVVPSSFPAWAPSSSLPLVAAFNL